MTDTKGAETVHNLGTAIVSITTEGCHHEELTTWVENNDIINGFKGFTIVTESKLNEDVPIEFPDSEITETIEETYFEDVLTFNEATMEEEISKVEKSRIIIVYSEDTDEDGNLLPLMRQKKWYEYAGKTSIDEMQLTKDGTYFLTIGKRNMPNGNRKGKVFSEEFYLWVNYFGVANIYTPSCYYNFITENSNE